MEAPGFWDDPERSNQKMKELKNLKDTVGECDKLSTQYDDILTLIDMGYEENDESLIPEIRGELDEFIREFDELRIGTLLSGEYDKNNAILKLNAGAGGTESCDWCGMLYRMYTRWAERRGFTIEVLDYLAGFTGNRIQDLLEEKGVRTDFISVEKGISRINVKLRSREETEISGQGPAIGEADIKKLYEKLDTLSDGDILVLAGSIPDVMPGSMYMDIMKHLQNKDLKIVVDATKDLLVNVLQYHPFLIKPNNHELGEIFGVKIGNKADVITYAKKMQEKGARNVLVSMAGDGAVLVAEDGSIFQSEAPKGKVVNSVGAGDSMVAGFIAGYLEDGSYGKAFQMGVCTGSASAFSEELATKAEVIALLDSNKKLFAGEQ